MFSWSPSNTAEFMRLHGENYSFGVIAAKLGCSRNSAIGKAHRMGLEKRKMAARPRVKSRLRPRVQRFREPLPQHDWHVIARMEYREIFDAAPPVEGCTLMDLSLDTCRWPLWEEVVSDQYCGAKPLDGSSYCPVHSKKAWRR
jgi:hypothetical protein